MMNTMMLTKICAPVMMIVSSLETAAKTLGLVFKHRNRNVGYYEDGNYDDVGGYVHCQFFGDFMLVFKHRNSNVGMDMIKMKTMRMTIANCLETAAKTSGIHINLQQ